METEKDGLIPGFIGEAMRKTQLETVVKEEDMGKDTNPLQHGKKPTNDMENSNDALNAAIAENAAIPSGPGVVITDDALEKFKNENNMNEMENLNEAMEADITMISKTTSKVISGKNGGELETNINKFLDANPNIEIVRTDFGTAVGGVYYTILYRTKVERV